MSPGSNVLKSAIGLLFLCCLAFAMLLSGLASPSWGDAPAAGGGDAPVVILHAPILLPERIISLGKALFSDTNLSNPPGQSCASCHGAAAGFKMPVNHINVQSGIAPGAVAGRFGNRIPPTISYAAYLPAGPPHFTGTVEAFAGGLFWDGHASTLTDQVPQPLQNPNEMNNVLHNVGDPGMVVQALQADANSVLFRQVYGDQVFSQTTTVVFNLIVRTIAAYEESPEISPFSSKYDFYLKGKVKLSDSELNGLRLVTGSTSGRPAGPANYKSAHCVDCHGIPRVAGDGPDLWTNSCYDNIGVPRNLANPYYTQTDSTTNPAGYNPDGRKYVDLGLGGFFYPFQYNLPPGNIGPGSDGQGDFLGINGDFKAPTLRNVDQKPAPAFVKRYTHNGYFTDLKTIVHFYNTRNLTTSPGEVIDFTARHPYANLQGKPLWPHPEYANPTTLQNASGAFNSQSAQVGNLGLTDAEENDIVAFLKSLTDGYVPPAAATQPALGLIAPQPALQSQ